MSKPTIYIETSVVSDLTARPSNHPVNAARQRATKEWWETQSANFELVSSTITEEEADQGDKEAARQRGETLQDMRILSPTDDVHSLVDSLLDSQAIPRTSQDDAYHVAIAAVNDIDYLLTWNQKHIVGPTARSRIRATCEREGYRCPGIYRPDELLGGQHLA